MNAILTFTHICSFFIKCNILSETYPTKRGILSRVSSERIPTNFREKPCLGFTHGNSMPKYCSNSFFQSIRSKRLLSAAAHSSYDL